MKKHNIIGIGELLWDVFPDGKTIGGAPTNFAYHTKNIGANSTIISAIGNDQLGDEIISTLKTFKLNAILNRSKNPTGVVNVIVKDGIPSYRIEENVAWDSITLNTEAIESAKKADAICFGTLAQRSGITKKAIFDLLKQAPASTLKVFDINLRQSYYNKSIIEESLHISNILKLNAEELDVLITLLNLDGINDEACTDLLHKYNLQLVALTNGGINSILFTSTNKSELKTPKIKIIDTIGAGDSFTAALVSGILNKYSLKETHQFAVEYAARICGIKGAIK